MGWSGDLAFALQVNCLSFTHFNDIVLATGSSDKSVAIWDLRRASEPVHRLCFHTDAVYKARFAPFNQTILATGGLDGKVLLWDLAKVMICVTLNYGSTGTAAWQ